MLNPVRRPWCQRDNASIVDRNSIQTVENRNRAAGWAPSVGDLQDFCIDWLKFVDLGLSTVRSRPPGQQDISITGTSLDPR